MMTSTALKILALIFMTVDHIGGHIPGMPIWLRWIGRLASPLFFFCAAESVVRTSNRRAYLKRLYRASFIMVMTEAVVPVFFERYFGLHLSGFNNNIFMTIFQGAIIIAILEDTKNDPAKRRKNLLWYVRYQIVLLLLIALTENVRHNIGFNINLIPVLKDWQQIAFTALGSVYYIEGPLLLVPQMVIFYLCRENKKKLCIWYTVYCTLYFLIFVPQLGIKARELWGNHRTAMEIIAFFLEALGIPTIFGAKSFTDSLLRFNFQWMMIFSLPFMLLYNGKRGKGLKKFFYIYYPVHLIVLSIIAAII